MHACSMILHVMQYHAFSLRKKLHKCCSRTVVATYQSHCCDVNVLTWGKKQHKLRLIGLNCERVYFNPNNVFIEQTG